MENTELEPCQNQSPTPACPARRDFLVQATAGGLVLSLAGAANSQTPQDKHQPVNEAIIKLSSDSPLAKVGGSQTVDTKAGKVIVVRIGDSNYVAYSAKCTHSGGPLSYDAAAKQFSCPWHGSTFSSEGQNTGGPARRPLKAFSTQNAIVLNLGASS